MIRKRTCDAGTWIREHCNLFGGTWDILCVSGWVIIDANEIIWPLKHLRLFCSECRQTTAFYVVDHVDWVFTRYKWLHKVVKCEGHGSCRSWPIFGWFCIGQVPSRVQSNTNLTFLRCLLNNIQENNCHTPQTNKQTKIRWFKHGLFEA